MESVHKAVLLHEVLEGLLRASRDTETFSRPAELASRNRTSPSGLSQITGQPSAQAISARSDSFGRCESSVSLETPDEALIYLDGTLGGAGHALAMAEALNGKLTIIGLDRDQQAIERAKKTLKDRAKNVILENEDFRNLNKVLATHKIIKVDRILFDLGLSSDEIEESGRGFSFKKDEPLLMTFGDPATYPFTACDIVNGWKEEDIANVIFAYGEERYARRIAKAIVEHRRKGENRIETSGQLAEIVRSSVPSSYGHGKIHPATRTFQALRITVNDELAALKEGLTKAWNALGERGILAVISFHSLEDRIVKEFFKEKAKIKVGKMTEGILINKKPITASPQEISENPRSRSAKLRIIEKVE
jgi:16S rRNA (cytosine1402-N4)-methyltransferase